jgi:alkaline phosphatase D
MVVRVGSRVLALVLAAGHCVAGSGAAVAQNASEKQTTVIAFGSCNREDRPQPLWSVIARHKPDVFVWLGDDIYGDTDDMTVMRAKYEKQLANPLYRAFRGEVPIIGTWDDHDYGLNDGGREFGARAPSQQAHLDFLGEPAHSPRRQQEGLYASYVYGAPGRQVKVILLDTRYHRDPIGSNGTVLGERQWTWLEKELRESKAQVHLIGSSIQVIAEQHRFEKWANFPSERKRLLDVIAAARAPGVIFLSGDRHIAELSVLRSTQVGYPVHDVTSSGLTHTSSPRKEANRHRVGRPVFDLNYGLVVVDWAAQRVRLQVLDARGVRIERVLSLPELRGRTAW